jgi:hypothetical protein
MKAHTGEEIICKCPRPAGTFLSDVDQGSSISSEDIAIFLPGAVDDFGCWVCPKCGEEVAQRYGADQWRAKTKRGWLS